MKHLPVIYFITFFISICSTAYTQDSTEQSAIDKQLQQCLDSDKNTTTYGMMQCTLRARNAWDAELNKYYKLLMQLLSNDEKATLKTAQKSWLNFRDAETNFSSAFYNNMGGTMWSVVKVQNDLDLLKQRTLQLKAYYQDKMPK